jgi:hypothetical protein
MEEGYFEPKEHERTWYRHATTGDRGYSCRRGGKECIRYDRPNIDHTVLHRPHDWIPDNTPMKIPEAQLVQVAFDADRKLCLLLGRYDLAKREWIGLTDDQKIKWMRQGPQTPQVRRKMYLGIMDVLREMNNGS